jgi:hypothetical protein
MHHYMAYGLRISSEIALPPLTPASGQGDVSIRWDSDIVPAADAANPIVTNIGRDRSELSFHPFACFAVRGGRDISVRPTGDLEAIRLYLLGVVSAVLLYQRGFFVLHASSVNIDGRAVAFAGHVGAGKSTVAAALHRRGHSILADDNTAVDWQADAPHVLPAFPQLKIAPDVASWLGYDARDLAVLHPLEPKRACPVASGFPADSAPFHSLFLLATGESMAVEPLSEREAFLHLLVHSMPARLTKTASPEHFSVCARAAACLPVFRLRRRDTLEDLVDLARLVERHVSG